MIKGNDIEMIKVIPSIETVILQEYLYNHSLIIIYSFIRKSVPYDISK